MKIILARHGDAVNSDGKFHGIDDKPLTSEGRSEVYATAKELRQYHPTMIYYCPTQRTRETATILANELNIPRKKSDALLPLDLGTFVGKDSEKFLSAIKHYLTNPEEKIPGGQSVNDWAKQYLPFFEKAFLNKSRDAIIFVTHGRNILLTKAYLSQDKLAPNFDKDVLLDSKTSTEHGGYALVDNKGFRIMDPKKVIAGQS